MNYSEVLIWIASFWMLVTVGLPFIIEFIYEKIAKPKTEKWRSFWSWLIPIAIMYVIWFGGNMFEVETFLNEYTLWWTPAIFGGLAAAISNYGWNNVPWIKQIIVWIIGQIPKRKK